MGSERGVVGMEWSAVATVWPGWRTLRPRARRPEKACGLVTSCTRWRSTARTAGAPGSCVTTWSSQILATMVRGSVMPRSVAVEAETALPRRGRGLASAPVVSGPRSAAATRRSLRLAPGSVGRRVRRSRRWDGRQAELPATRDAPPTQPAASRPGDAPPTRCGVRAAPEVLQGSVPRARSPCGPQRTITNLPPQGGPAHPRRSGTLRTASSASRRIFDSSVCGCSSPSSRCSRSRSSSRRRSSTASAPATARRSSSRPSRS